MAARAASAGKSWVKKRVRPPTPNSPPTFSLIDKSLLPGAEVEFRKLVGVRNAIAVQDNRILSGRHVPIHGSIWLDYPGYTAVQPHVGALLGLVRPVVAVDPDPRRAGRNRRNRFRARRRRLSAMRQDQEEARKATVQPNSWGARISGHSPPPPVILMGQPTSATYSPIS